ncbi:MAG: dynamin family protein, partial [Acidimicrobiales bacterium]
MSTALRAEVMTLLEDAATSYAGAELAPAISELRVRFEEPLRVAFAGKVKAGKSTLLNALIGEELAPTDAGECTKIVTWYRNSHTYRVTMHPRVGPPRQAPFNRDDGAIDVELGGIGADAIDHLEVEWPSQRLAEVTLIDTPGLASLHDEHSARTRRFLAIDDDADAGEADAVIYLMRHLHAADLGFLESFHDDTVARANPISTVGVLSRADEVGACRRDAMTAARRVADRYRRDPRLRRLCQTIVPVAGLVAEAAATLTEAEYRSLQTLAQTDRAIIDELLLSVDRMMAENDDVALTPIERQDLLHRLGLYGVRLAVSLIRVGGADTSSQLVQELRRTSGVEELRALLGGLFAARRDVLKARAVLAGLEAMLRTRGDDHAERLLAELERIT